MLSVCVDTWLEPVRFGTDADDTTLFVSNPVAPFSMRPCLRKSSKKKGDDFFQVTFRANPASLEQLKIQEGIWWMSMAFICRIRHNPGTCPVESSPHPVFTKSVSFPWRILVTLWAIFSSSYCSSQLAVAPSSHQRTPDFRRQRGLPRRRRRSPGGYLEGVTLIGIYMPSHRECVH